MTEQNSAIIEISRAEQALSRANDIHEMIVLRDEAAALELFANAQGFKEAAQKAKIFQLKAERKAGGWLQDNVNHSGGDPDTLYQSGTAIPEGVDRHESSRWQLEASLPEDKFNEWVDESLARGWEISAGALRRIAQNHAGLPVSGGRSFFDRLSNYAKEQEFDEDKSKRYQEWFELGKEFFA